jgi:hypothetical protein
MSELGCPGFLTRGASFSIALRAELNRADGRIEQRRDPFAIIESTKKGDLNVLENDPRIGFLLERRCNAQFEL